MGGTAGARLRDPGSLSLSVKPHEMLPAGDVLSTDKARKRHRVAQKNCSSASSVG